MYHVDENGRLRDHEGRFARLEPHEVCPNGCQRFGDWWAVTTDCPTHLVWTEDYQ